MKMNGNFTSVIIGIVSAILTTLALIRTEVVDMIRNYSPYSAERVYVNKSIEDIKNDIESINSAIAKLREDVAALKNVQNSNDHR